MIDELREFLVDRDVDCMQITRLEFRSDLKYGDKKRIWQAFGTMLNARGKNRYSFSLYCSTKVFAE